MPWWAWMLAGWALLALVVALVLGAVAAKARLRERAARRRQYDGAMEQEWREAA